MVGEVPDIYPPVVLVAILPGEIHPIIPSWVHLQARPGVPHCCCRTREGSLAALTRAVAELTVRKR